MTGVEYGEAGDARVEAGSDTCPAEVEAEAEEGEDTAATERMFGSFLLSFLATAANRALQNQSS